MNANFISRFKRHLASINLGYAIPMSLDEKLWRLENDPAWVTIDLPIDGRSDMVEEVIAEKIGEDRFRLASSPGMARGLAADDIIVLDTQTPAGYRLIQRGDNVCVHVYCEAEKRAVIQAGLVQTLGQIGGVLDGTMGETGLCFTIPVLATFTAIEGALHRIVGEEWTYSNVNDIETDAPLNWWLKR